MKKIIQGFLVGTCLLTLIGCGNATPKIKQSVRETEESQIIEIAESTTENTAEQSRTDNSESTPPTSDDTPTFDVLSKDDLDMLDWKPYSPKPPTKEVLAEELSIIAKDRDYNLLYNRVTPSEFTWFVNTYLDTPGFDILFITLVSDKEPRDTLMLVAIKDGADSYATAEKNVNSFLGSSEFQESIQGYYKNENALSRVRGLSLKSCWADYSVGQPIS